MKIRVALIVLVAALPACGPTTAPVESRTIERGTALPPPGLAAPARN